MEHLKLREIREEISEKTVGNYMRELGIKAQYMKPYIGTTINLDFSSMAGSKWKLFDKAGKRIASLCDDGGIREK